MCQDMLRGKDCIWRMEVLRRVARKFDAKVRISFPAHVSALKTINQKT